MGRLGIVLIVLLSLAGTGTAQQPVSPAPTDVAVKAGKILDVRTGTYLADQIIWIEGGKIKSIGKAADLMPQLPAGIRTIDLSNATILPGLIDCHVHLTMTPYSSGPAGLHASYPRMALIGAHNARITLEAGFTN